MKIADIFPSAYLRASDLRGGTVKVTIADCTLEPLDGEQKPVLQFRSKDKRMVLNKTNAVTIPAAYSEETLEGNGREIELFSDKVMLQDNMIDSIRVRVSALAKPELDEIPF